MAAIKFTVNTDRSYEDGANEFLELYKKYRWLRVSIVPGAPKTAKQVRMNFELYGHIGQWFHGGGNRGTEAARRECKLNFGVPILRRDDPDFDENCSKVLDGLDYEDQVKSMKFMDVTSLMTRAQEIEYINDIIDHYAEQGCMWPDYVTAGRNHR